MRFHAPRHRRDVLSVAASARWRGDSTPSTRCCPRGRVGSMVTRSVVDFHTARHAAARVLDVLIVDEPRRLRHGRRRLRRRHGVVRGSRFGHHGCWFSGAGSAAEFQDRFSLALSRARAGARGNNLAFCLCSNLGSDLFFAVCASDSRPSVERNTIRAYACVQTALLDGQQRSAKVGLLLENPFYEGVRETHLFATTPLSTKQKIMCRPGRRWGWGPRFDAPGAGRTVRGRSAATRFSARIA